MRGTRPPSEAIEAITGHRGLLGDRIMLIKTLLVALLSMQPAAAPQAKPAAPAETKPAAASEAKSPAPATEAAKPAQAVKGSVAPEVKSLVDRMQAFYEK